MNRSNRSPIPNAPVVMKEANGYYTTDVDGIAKISVPNSGFYSIRVVTGNSVIVRQKEITQEGQVVNIYIDDADVGKDTIRVTGEADKVKLSRYSFQQDEIKRLPGAQGDSLKALQTLPGVVPALPVGINSSGSFGSFSVNGSPYRNSERGDLALRGAGTNANQYYFDGFPVSYPFHIGNQSSVFNNNIIKSLDVYSGSYSARYGYASGGIINIEGKDSVKSTRTTINFNLFQSDAMVERKITENSYVIAAVRKNYPNYTLLKLYPDGIPSDAKYANYEDFQLKSGWDISKEHKLMFTTFGSRDIQKYTKTVDEATNSRYGSNATGPIGGADSRPPVGLDRSFRTDGVRYTYQPGDKISNTLSISRNSYKEFYELKFDNPLSGENIFGLQNVTTQNIYYVENVLNYNVWKEYLKFQIGGTYRGREITQKAENVTQSSSEFSRIFNNLIQSDPTFRALIDGDGVRSKELGAFAELNFSYKGFKFMPGVREDYYNLSNQKVISPRLNTSYTFEKLGTTFLAGAGDHYNAPTGIGQVSSRVGNDGLNLEKGEHMAVGVSQDINSDWLVKVEGFRNIYSNLVVSDSYIQDPYALNNQTSDIIEKSDDVFRNPIKPKPLRYSNNGTGHSEGVEVYLKKTKRPEDSGWYGWISYTNSLTKRNNHQTRYSDQERNERSALNASRTLLAQTQNKYGYVNYYNDNQLELVYDNDREELYDLDRTHVLNIVAGWKINSAWQIGGRYRYLTNTPFTPITGSSSASQAATSGFTLNLPSYSTYYNSARQSPWQQLDIRIDKFHNYNWGYINVYFELINSFGRRNPSGETFSNTESYQAGKNPSTNYDTTNSPYIETMFGGKTVYIPLLNFGVEVRF
ncbi:TonB-dependent receptor [Leptospira ilyithenensis]|uniref:TonB-dependent receptor n=1 Tax=Leptospira ilyithenensis TaxID=2484901 RepID=A0A4R9LPU9_9LEPT|nr:TonB-dependent receptor [Leptospira ilyithenensis]